MPAMLDQVIAYLRGEWAVIDEAPASFALGAIIITTVTYFYVRHQIGDRLQIAEDRSRFKDELMAEYGSGPAERQPHQGESCRLISDYVRGSRH
jgi:hypothetical protein